MEPMTPEERLTKIENLLNTAAEHHAKHDETLNRHAAEIDKHAAAIRDLIVLSRTFLDSQKEMTSQLKGTDERFNEKMEQLREAQQHTDEKLNILIETVDRIIRNKQN